MLRHEFLLENLRFELSTPKTCRMKEIKTTPKLSLQKHNLNGL